MQSELSCRPLTHGVVGEAHAVAAGIVSCTGAANYWPLIESPASVQLVSVERVVFA